VRIRLSDGSFFVLHAEVHARAGIRAGDELAPGRVEELCTESELVAARQKALALIARAPHTRRGLARKLSARGFSEGAVRAAITRVSELGYLDDGAFAENWVRARLSARAEGFKSLYKGLLQRGVPRDAAERAAAAACSDEAELENARRAAGSLSGPAAARRLAARGFRSRTISRFLKEIRERDREGGRA
jgi:regulatory protein